MMSEVEGKGKDLAEPVESSFPPQANQGIPLDQDQNAHDPKRLKRIMINRESSRRTRLKKEIKIMELEQLCARYTVDTQLLSAAIQHTLNQIAEMKKENDYLRAQIVSLSLELELKEVTKGMIKRELEDLNQLHAIQMQLQQQIQLQANMQAPPNQGNIPRRN